MPKAKSHFLINDVQFEIGSIATAGVTISLTIRAIKPLHRADDTELLDAPGWSEPRGGAVTVATGAASDHEFNDDEWKTIQAVFRELSLIQIPGAKIAPVSGAASPEDHLTIDKIPYTSVGQVRQSVGTAMERLEREGVPLEQDLEAPTVTLPAKPVIKLAPAQSALFDRLCTEVDQSLSGQSLDNPNHMKHAAIAAAMQTMLKMPLAELMSARDEATAASGRDVVKRG